MHRQVPQIVSSKLGYLLMRNTVERKKQTASPALHATYRALLILATLLLPLSQACSPDVDSRACNDDGDCFTGEECVAGTCEATGTGDTGSDSGLEWIPDSPTDVSDSSDGSVDAPEIGDADGGAADADEDQATDTDTGADSPEDVADLPDRRTDSHDLPEDPRAERDLTDSGRDGDPVDTDLDGGTPYACGSEGYIRKDIELFEPCAHPSLAFFVCSPE